MLAKNNRKLILIGGSVFGVFLILMISGMFDDSFGDILEFDVIDDITQNSPTLSVNCVVSGGKQYCYNTSVAKGMTYSNKVPTIVAGQGYISYVVTYNDGSKTTGSVSQKFPIEFEKLSLYGGNASPLKNVQQYKPIQSIVLQIFAKTNSGEKHFITSNNVSYKGMVKTNSGISAIYNPYSKAFSSTNLGAETVNGFVKISEIQISPSGVEEALRDRGTLFSGNLVYFEIVGKGTFGVRTESGKTYTGEMDDMKIKIPFVYKPSQAYVSGSFSSGVSSSSSSGYSSGAVNISTDPDEVAQQVKVTSYKAISLCGEKVNQATCNDIVRKAKTYNPFTYLSKLFGRA